MPRRMTRALFSTLLPCLALGMPLTAGAAEPRYNYVEAAYVRADIDYVDDDGGGLRVGGSAAVHPNFHVLADYQQIDLSGDNDYSAFRLGVGYNYRFRPNLDGVARLRYISAEFDRTRRGGDNDEDGYGIELGVRTMINSALEFNGGLRYTDVFDDTTSLALGVLYDVIPSLSLGGELEFADDYTALALQVRYNFGSRYATGGR